MAPQAHTEVLLTELQSLFLRGLASFSRPDREVLETVAKYIKARGVLVKYVSGHPRAFCLIHWPEDALSSPQIMHFYSEAPRSATRHLISRVLDVIRERGYSRFNAVNGSGVDDAIWLRVFRSKDWTIKPVKTVFEFEVKSCQK